MTKAYIFRMTHIENIPHIIENGITHKDSDNSNKTLPRLLRPSAYFGLVFRTLLNNSKAFSNCFNCEKAAEL